jgi:hypothetical protein
MISGALLLAFHSFATSLTTGFSSVGGVFRKITKISPVLQLFPMLIFPGIQRAVLME